MSKKNETSEERAARKAARKLAKKQAKLAAKQAGATSVSPSDDKAARKAARKAAKKEKKAKKAARKELKRKAVEESSLDTPAVKKAKVEEKAATKSVEVEVKSVPVKAEGSFDAAAWRAEHAMEIKGATENGSGLYVCPEPFMSFEATPFPQSVLQAVKSAGYEKPTPIQSQSWPIALQGRDIISIARTGSGKTCGFLFPTFDRIHRLVARRPHTSRDGPLAVVLAPTRELAMQIQVEAVKFGRPQGIRSVVLYGGAPKRRQIGELERGLCHMIVATPGRLNDLLEMRKTNMNLVSVLILDEADRMLDMGFEPQINSIVDKMPPQKSMQDRPLPSSGLCDATCRQTLFFSATWPREVQRAASYFLMNPVQLNVGKSGQLVANEDVEQIVRVVEPNDKMAELMKIIESLPENAKTIVFVAKKRDCDMIANKLWNDGMKCDSIHGDKDQYQRTQVLNWFKSGRTTLLFATDVAARGLDVKDITHVINYDFPNGKGKVGIEDYVHRIGRTGRAGRKGTAYTLFTYESRKNAYALIQLLKSAKQVVPEELLKYGQRKPRAGGSGRRWGGGRGRGRGRGGRGRGRGGGFGGRGGGFRRSW